jgi:enterochelin esterase-like enzyme
VTRTRRTAVAVLLALGCGAGAATVLAARGTVIDAPAPRVIDTSFESEALNATLHFLVVLPAGYDTTGLRYPVIYFLHGLPAGPTAYRSVAWVGTAAQQTGRQAIVVIPQGTRAQNGDPEYHDWGPGRNWETALAVELPRWIDQNYRTIPNRSGRAVIGLSAGGYGAAILDAHHPGEYSVMESWSGYFRPTDPTGEKTLDVGSDADNAYASVVDQIPQLKAAFARQPTYFAFYVGRSDPTFVADNVQLDQQLTAAHVRHVFDLYPGGHDSALWQAHAVRWLGNALNNLAPPSAQ